MPLCTIFTKWPAADRTAVQIAEVRGLAVGTSGRVVGSMPPGPGRQRFQNRLNVREGLSSHPAIRQYPRSRPHTPPLVPTSA